MLDTGIAKKFTKDDHKLLVDVLAGFIQGDGVRAGNALIRDSLNRTSIRANDEAGFVKVLDDMCERAKKDMVSATANLKWPFSAIIDPKLTTNNFLISEFF